MWGHGGSKASWSTQASGGDRHISRPLQRSVVMEAQWAEEHRARGAGGGAVVVEGSPEEVAAEQYKQELGQM